MELQALSEIDLQNIYKWIDQIPLTRPKKNMGRDFADGAMIAEVIHHYVPKYVELHNYPQAHSIQQKQYNWSTLNLKVFKRLGFQITKNDIDAIINVHPEAIEKFLKLLQMKIEKYLEYQKEQEKKLQEQAKIKEQQQLQQKQGQSFQQPPPSSDYRQQIEERDGAISELRETVEILQLKIRKLEQLVQIKDSKIQSLINQLQTQQ